MLTAAQQALKEAKRCIQCGARCSWPWIECWECRKFLPQYRYQPKHSDSPPLTMHHAFRKLVHASAATRGDEVPEEVRKANED
jgi:hypothetical protein